MSLRFSTVLFTGTVLAVSMLAHALPAKNTSVKATLSPTTITSKSSSSPITIESLARVQGILNYCATVDPKSSGKYHQTLNNILFAHPTSELNEDESNPRYTYALGVVDQGIAKLPMSTVVSACQNLISGK